MTRSDLFGCDPPKAQAAIINATWLGRKCRVCSGETFITTKPSGPHREGVKCITCGNHNGWLSAVMSDELRASQTVEVQA
jgi:hypothetical protein